MLEIREKDRERERQNQEAVVSYNKYVTLNSHDTDSHFHQSGKLSPGMINVLTYKPSVKAHKYQNAPHETDNEAKPNNNTFFRLSIPPKSINLPSCL